MTDWLSTLPILVAQAAAEAPPQGQAANPFWLQALMLGVMGVAAYFLLFMPERRRQERLLKLQAEKDQLLKVKEKDHIVTSGGIYGVITNVQRDVGRATLRIDEANGTKIRIELASIARILTSDEKASVDTK